MTTKVAILGKLPSKFQAPFNNEEWDIWAFNYHKEQLPRVTQWFDIHANYPNPMASITRDNFPFAEVNKLVGGQYFNNSVSYLIAYAILKGYKEIALFGMRFYAEHETRRNGEYQNVRELIFFAKGKGVKVTAQADTSILTGYPLYGV